MLKNCFSIANLICQHFLKGLLLLLNLCMPVKYRILLLEVRRENRIPWSWSYGQLGANVLCVIGAKHGSFGRSSKCSSVLRHLSTP